MAASSLGSHSTEWWRHLNESSKSDDWWQRHYSGWDSSAGWLGEYSSSYDFSMTYSEKIFVLRVLLIRYNQRADRIVREWTWLVVSTDAKHQEAPLLVSDVTGRSCRCVLLHRLKVRNDELCKLRGIEGRIREQSRQATLCHSYWWRILLSFDELFILYFTPYCPVFCVELFVHGFNSILITTELIYG